MNITKKAAILLALSISLTACSSWYADRPSPAAGYNFRHDHFDFRYAWKTTRTDEGLRVAGLLKNIRYPRVEDVEVTVSLLNKKQDVIAEEVTFPVPQTMSLNDYRSFDFLFAGGKPAEVDRLRFRVGYRASEGGTQGLIWKSTFTVNAATGVLVGTSAFPVDEW